jgi:fatty acid-binding protein DegV
MVRYLFIDESGDLGLNGSRYLVLSCLIVSDEKPLERIIKNARRRTFKKELRKACEIKANKSSPEVIKHFLKKLNEVPDARVIYIVLEKKRVFSRYLQDNKHKLYNYVAGKLARYLELEGEHAIMRIDKSKGKQMLQEDFNSYFENNLKQHSKVASLEIHHSYSQSWDGLQFADLLAWAMFQKFERGNDEYVDLITIEPDIFHVW